MVALTSKDCVTEEFTDYASWCINLRKEEELVYGPNVTLVSKH